MESRSGTWKKNLSGEAAYLSFVPALLPLESPLAMNDDILDMLCSAVASISLLNGLARRIPNTSIFISMYVRKEALLSSQIEGTQATLEDVFDPLIDENANINVAEVVNYIRATEYAIARLKHLPLSNRLIRETHAVLMQGVRGQERSPGEFRRSQNWIGGAGSTLKAARYIPPEPGDMDNALGNLELYMNQDTRFKTSDILIRAALIHYQFETIHPFLDGNGRIGRLLNTLFLMEKGALTAPILYISYYLKQNRLEYYDRLTRVRTHGDYEQWVIFFLTAIKVCSDDAIDSIDRLSALHENNAALVSGMGRASKSATRLLRYIEARPVIDIGKTAADLGLSFNTVDSAVKRFQDAGILLAVDNARRNRSFHYKAYLDILRSGTE